MAPTPGTLAAAGVESSWLHWNSSTILTQGEEESSPVMCICAVDYVAILCSFQQEMKTLGVAIHGWKQAHRQLFS